MAFQSEGGANPGNLVTGDAANITANLRLDAGAANAIDDTNPTELEGGYYVFDITQAESNADSILIVPTTTTPNVIVLGVPGAVYTTLPMRGTDGVDTATMRGTDGVDTTAMRGTDGVDTSTMRGTDGANTTTPPTVVAVRQEIDSNSIILAAIKADTVVPARNVAFSNMPILMVLTSDHATPATGLTVTGERSIDGGVFSSVAGTIAEVSNGIYKFNATQADMNGDIITFRFSSATADDIFLTIRTR